MAWCVSYRKCYRIYRSAYRKLLGSKYSPRRNDNMSIGRFIPKSLRSRRTYLCYLGTYLCVISWIHHLAISRFLQKTKHRNYQKNMNLVSSFMCSQRCTNVCSTISTCYSFCTYHHILLAHPHGNSTEDSIREKIGKCRR